MPAPVVIRGEGLTIADVEAIAHAAAPVQIDDDPTLRARIAASVQVIRDAIAAGKEVYGVTTPVGANATRQITAADTVALQRNLLWMLKAGAGDPIPRECVRAGMALRLNSLARGVSGVRLEVLERLAIFLNHGATPRVREFGSIGASGDLVPLATIAGCLIGLGDGYAVELDGRTLDAREALAAIGLDPIELEPKEGVALINGTSVMTGIAALCVAEADRLLRLTMATHALTVQALCGSEASFHPFVHGHKPHPGQLRVAACMRALLSGSGMTREAVQRRGDSAPKLAQDRYSLRCIPQYMAPIVEGLAAAAGVVTIELNAATDNPLIDPESGEVWNGGNFLGQSVAVAMDQLRYLMGLAAKHVDVQIAVMMAPEFSNGLPMSLSGDDSRAVNMGLKGLQLLGNSIMPLISFHGHSLVDRFPVHAEQYNQNINSQGYGAANLTRRTLEMYRRHAAVALIIATQAVDLRARALGGERALPLLSPGTRPVYTAVREHLGVPADAPRPLIERDAGQDVEAWVDRLAADIESRGGRLADAVSGLTLEL